MDSASLALLELARQLERAGYHFVTPTPETQRRVVARRAQARSLRDVFGWSLRFERGLLPDALFELASRAGVLQREGEHWRASVRFSALQRSLYVHSAYPTDASDAVFFGPDTYRFCSWLRRVAPPASALVDIGCGSGAGGLCAAEASGATRVVLADINEQALAFAAVNAALAERTVELAHSDLLRDVAGAFSLIVANPPYMRDPAARLYRDGGGAFGEQLSLRIVRESLARLGPGGTLLLYTGSAIVDGKDPLYEALAELLCDLEHHYEELDPDVFGEELERPGYERVERIAAVALSVRTRA